MLPTSLKKNKELLFFGFIFLLVLPLTFMVFLARSRRLERTSKKQQAGQEININKEKADRVLAQIKEEQDGPGDSQPEISSQCLVVPQRDPLKGATTIYDKFNSEGYGLFWYEGWIREGEDLKIGNCEYNQITLERTGAGGRRTDWTITFPSGLLDTKGSLGTILPKILQNRKDMRVKLKVRYEKLTDGNLKMVSWEVVNLYVN